MLNEVFASERSYENARSPEARKARKVYLRNCIDTFDRLWTLLKTPGGAAMFNRLTYEQTGRYLTASAFTRHGLSRDRLEPTERDLGLREPLRDDHRYSWIEEAAVGLRESAARENGHVALGVLLISLRNRLKRQLDFMNRDKGGRPEDLYRKHAILELAEAYLEFTGRKATATASGKFTNLCSDIFPLLNINTDGLESALKRYLNPKRRCASKGKSHAP
jgi:hypothetical protein